MPSQIALQLYTLRQFTQTPDDLARTFARVKEIGYDAVQVSAIGKIEPAVLATLLKNAGLVCCATHVGFDRMRDDTAAVIADHQAWGCKYAAIGGAHFKEPSATAWREFIDQYNAIAEQFAGSGVALGYHNHDHEFIKFDGQRPMDMMRAGFRQEIWMELDVYWVAHAGGDPAAYVAQWNGQLPCIHLKDKSVVLDAAGAKAVRMAEVGEGNLNWPAILAAARAAGTEWFIVEQDDCYGVDPFECAARSLRNVKAMGLA